MFPWSSAIAQLASIGSSALVDPASVASLPVNPYALVPLGLFIAAFAALGLAVEAVRRMPPAAGPQGGHLGRPLDTAA
jgi:hypothetical protein